MSKRYMQFVDMDARINEPGRIHEVQVPTVFEGIARVEAMGDVQCKHVLTFRLPDGTTPMIAMPRDYRENWQFCGYRKEE